MVLIQNLRHIACLAACVFLASPIQAMPVEASNTLAERGSGSGKRIILWESKTTSEITIIPGLLTAAASLGSSSVIKSITNWETWRPDELPKKYPFRPMIRTPEHLKGKKWDQLISVVSSQKDTVVHFYNEPERAGIKVTTAVADWRAKMLPLRKEYSVKLAGPGVASSPEGSAWLEQFMGALKDDEKPDYLNLHFYTMDGNPCDQEIKAAKTFFSEKHSTYKLPVIVGEIASTSREKDDVVKFTKEVSKWMELPEQSWVVEYGFFGVSTKVVDDFVSPFAQLLDSKGAWTDLGKWWIGLSA